MEKDNIKKKEDVVKYAVVLNGEETEKMLKESEKVGKIKLRRMRW